MSNWVCFSKYAISASLAGPGRVVGDLLVNPESARGRVDSVRKLGGLHHFDLLNHPRVYEAMRAWLAP